MNWESTKEKGDLARAIASIQAKKYGLDHQPVILQDKKKPEKKIPRPSKRGMIVPDPSNLRQIGVVERPKKKPKTRDYEDIKLPELNPIFKVIDGVNTLPLKVLLFVFNSLKKLGGSLLNSLKSRNDFSEDDYEK